MNFHGKEMLLSFCELLAFRNTINAIDIDSHFYNDHSGIEIVPLCNLKEILILETTDVIELKKIIHAIFTPKEVEVLN
ncbi:hypothetical protein GWK08_08555 [Leptobacterium flavescens]|uniref:Uncharacterized protein n=1 Tax=Leptobacterium flavescens TaxID=472055 RepID=A0A6P0UJT9_9FLAO|nr:hypothetical protein [Leptobacterium flavescens]NER13484.1 hypothetical protein [Leptobacterium flavescens]